MNKNKNFIFGVGIVLLGLVGFALVARPAPSGSDGLTATVSDQTDQGSALTAEKTSYDFGSIRMVDGKVMHSFRFSNTGLEPVLIKKIYTSCMCTAATLLVRDSRRGPFGMPGHGPIPRVDETVQPNESADVEVVFDPAAHGPAGIGRVNRVVYIETEKNGVLELRFTANVTP